MRSLLVGIAAGSRAIVSAALGARGHIQLEADDGARALAVLLAESPALVVVQDPLADMSAAEFCRRARACRGGVDAVILVLANREDELAAILDSGATDLYSTTHGPAALQTRVLIAERLVVEHARLRDREVRFRRLFDSGVAGVTIADFDGNFKEANDTFLKMLGYTHAEMLAGKLSWEVITPHDCLVADTEARAQLQATGFLPLRERTYVHKDGRHIAALVGSAALDGTTECISYVTDISERKRSEEALRASEAQYRTLFEESPIPKLVFDYETHRYLAVNGAAIRSYGYTRDEFLTMTLEDLRPLEDVPALLASLAAPSSATARPGPWRHVKKDGRVIDVEITVHRLMLGGRQCGITVAQDVTERNRLEEELRQAQKVEALGGFAAGIAHDFNNLLCVILSYTEMLAASFAPGNETREDLDEILAAGKRAAELTGQLLAFSRRQVARPRILDLNAIIEDVVKMLRRLVGRGVEVTFVGDPGVGSVSADRGQLEQVLVNLVVNARDAMPTGGKVTIETSDVDLDAGYAATHAGVSPGRYVMLAVTDTGSGMDAETRDRVFERFFTTKEPGKGTGLGLSTVLGIVQRSGGSISLCTEPGRGTTFKVYLPRAPASARCLGVVAPHSPTELRQAG